MKITYWLTGIAFFATTMSSQRAFGNAAFTVMDEMPVWMEMGSLADDALHFDGTFPPISIAVTLLSGAKTINHTGVEAYTDASCATTTGNSFNIGSPGEFTFATSKTYKLGLSATTYTSFLFNENAGSMKVTLDANGGASGNVCIPISCSSTTNCATTVGGPFALSI